MIHVGRAADNAIPICHFSTLGTRTNGEYRARSSDAPDPLESRPMRVKNIMHMARLKWIAVLFYPTNNGVHVCWLEKTRSPPLSYLFFLSWLLVFYSYLLLQINQESH